MIFLFDFFLFSAASAQETEITAASPVRKLDVNGNLTVRTTYTDTNAAP